MEGEIIESYKCVRIPLLIVMTKHITMIGTTMYFVAAIKPDCSTYYRRPFMELEHARELFDREVLVDG